MTSTDRIFNVIPSPRDKRDLVYSSTLKLDRSVDLRLYDSPVEDQGALGSCVAHAVTSAYENQLRARYPNEYRELSRMFLYYHTRFLENTISQDAGVVYLRSAMKAGKKFGICREDLWDYNINEFKEQPRPDCYVDAANRKIIAYKSIQSVTDIIDSLNYGVPVVIALEIFKGFMSLDAKNPTIPIPSVTEDAIGGHAVTIVGYSETNQHFIFKNSFGTDWGLDGYGYMTLEYVRLYVFEKWAFSITNPFDPCLNERPPDPL